MYASTHRLGKESAFTLIETVLAIGLISILATTATPVFIDVAQQAQLNSEEGVVGSVRTGTTLQQMEELAVTGLAAAPPTLDDAPIGVIANGNNPFFTAVLNPAITSGWRKEATHAYRSPTGRRYVYHPETGAFTPESESSETDAGSLGNVLYEYAGIAFYDTGAIVDTTSSLAYIPSLTSETVTLNLASGTTISTQSDGSALITLSDGETLKVADTHKPAFFQLKPETEPANEQSSGYLWLNQGQASEGKQTTTWHKKEYQAKGKEGSFHYEYDLDGEYSGGSLKKEFGFIHRTNYHSKAPQVSKGTWEKKENGDYEGTMEHTYNYESEAKSGYGHPEAKYRYAFQQEGQSEGWSKTDYTYEAAGEKYASTLQGHHKHRIDRDASNGPFQADVEYDYEGTTNLDKPSGRFASEFRYQYKDGRDLTYRYESNQKDGSYEWSVTDNKTGKVTRQTNKKEEKQEEKKEQETEKED